MLAIQLMRLSQQSRQVAVTAERNRMAAIFTTPSRKIHRCIVQLEAAADAKSKGLVRRQRHISVAPATSPREFEEARRSVRALRPQALEEKTMRSTGGLIRKMTAGTTVRAEFILQGTHGNFRPSGTKSPPHRTGGLTMRSGTRTPVILRRVSCSTREDSYGTADNGCGFDPEGKHDGFGLVGMRERVEGMGGEITIQSASGAGTAIFIGLPHADDSLEPRMNTDEPG